MEKKKTANNLKIYPVLFILLIMSQGCALFIAQPERVIERGFYHIRYPEITEERIYVNELEDSVLIYLFDEKEPDKIREIISLPLEVPSDQYYEISFRKSSFDLDILSFLFKYRPQREDMPRQLNAEMSGVLYAGFRRDIYSIGYVPDLPGIMQMEISHTGFSFGIFSGFGSTFISPWVTMEATEREYDGVVWMNGVAALMATPNINIAIGSGFDHLLDRNRRDWIYQHQPWIGFAVGIDLN
jgi:hypothetical protein